jgi:hypothetical protein
MAGGFSSTPLAQGSSKYLRFSQNGGEAIQVMPDGGFAPLESPDGKSFV